MKYSLLVFIFSSIVSFGEGIPEMNYNIVSDTALSSIPKGKCLVHGVVTFQKESFEGCKIASEDHKFEGLSNSKGEYQFLMDAQEIRVYAFQPGYNEVVTKKYNFKSGHRVHVDFFMTENIQVEISLKPIIYAYNNKEIETKIEMELTGELTFSYPEYEEGWDVVVKKEGLSLIKNKTKTYPYLFWEGETPGLNFQSSNSNFQGFQINTDSTIQFLENQCGLFGFNQIETTDFITFWAPRIQQHEVAKIEFLLDKQYDVIGKLKVTPKPDNTRRLYIFFQGSDDFDPSLQYEQVDIEPFSRNGFTILEWGGTELAPNKRMNP